MKFFLSSIRVPNKKELVQLFGNNPKMTVALVPNARDLYPEDIQKVELANTISQFEKIGFKATVLDFVTSSAEFIKEQLRSNSFLWVMGGNTFYLNYRIRMSGFDKLLKNALDNGLVYGGSSAGAIIVGPTLHGVENVDNPKDAQEVIWEGLGLVEVGIVPHWGLTKYASKLEKMRDEMRQHLPNLIIITDDQAVLIIDDKIEVH